MPLGALLGGIGGIMAGNKAARGAMDAAGALVGAADVAANRRVDAYDAARGLSDQAFDINSQTLGQILDTNRRQFRANMSEQGDAYGDIRRQNRNAFMQARNRLDPLVADGTRARDAMMYNVGLGERPEGYAGFEGSPGYQWMVSQAEDAIRNQAAAGGSLASGATLKALTNYRTGAAAQDFGNYYNRLAGLAGSGDQARYALVGERNRLAANNTAARQNLANNRTNLRAGYAANQNAARSGYASNAMNILGNQQNLALGRGEALARRATDAANAYASGRMGATAGQTQAMQAGFGIPGGMLSEGLQLAGGIAGMGGFNNLSNALMNGTALDGSRLSGSSYKFPGIWGG